ncbi:LysM domain/BON superfamily protein [Limihaloglobus sulfuriphilus]|uniref:LysM domain/BON superfamily protein n=1 Tax=Limihaloglobus sulfuriphilus TaxID=1851148 RepID=A0A1Q2MG88_9BACT|nr:LysM peptidoglycan-binding domain-containing protein [Limihaloglobus sulfuriphilus]AQQ71327.1 LysM domain/BON superfamily protein [Limihaloglobus sulfuriphilus]
MRHLNKILMLVMLGLTIVILRVVNGPLFDENTAGLTPEDPYADRSNGIVRKTRDDIQAKTQQLINDLYRKQDVSEIQQIRNQQHLRNIAQEQIAQTIPQAARASVEKARENTIAADIKHHLVEVQKGDNLTKIAKRIYGCSNKEAHKYVKIIYEANSSVMKSPNDLKVGAKLTLPVVSDGSGDLDRLASAAPGVFEKLANGAGNVARLSSTVNRYDTYSVTKGDTLSEIATKKLNDGKRWKEIFEINKNILKSPDKLREGMNLRLPSS